MKKPAPRGEVSFLPPIGRGLGGGDKMFELFPRPDPPLTGEGSYTASGEELNPEEIKVGA